MAAQFETEKYVYNNNEFAESAGQRCLQAPGTPGQGKGKEDLAGRLSGTDEGV